MLENKKFSSLWIDRSQVHMILDNTAQQQHKTPESIYIEINIIIQFSVVQAPIISLQGLNPSEFIHFLFSNTCMPIEQIWIQGKQQLSQHPITLFIFITSFFLIFFQLYMIVDRLNVEVKVYSFALKKHMKKQKGNIYKRTGISLIILGLDMKFLDFIIFLPVFLTCIIKCFLC
ncbi:hypothetical protein ACJX0J_022720 [Zea mays]